MKKLFFLFFIFLALIPFAMADACQEAGYQFCWQYSYAYNDARANARIFFSIMDDIGEVQGNYAVGRLYANVGFRGDKLYVYRNLANWDNVRCDGNGCNGQEIRAGEYNLARLGEQFNGNLAFVAWDYDRRGNAWAWARAGYGWVGNARLNKMVVNCYNDEHCAGNEFCNRAGNWQEWQCQFSECNARDERCEGNNYINCENHRWQNIGPTVNKCQVDCIEGDRCEDRNYFVCENYRWQNRGEVVGQCGVEEPGEELEAVCGNNICEIGETFENCPEDCEAPEEPPIEPILLYALLIGGIGFLIFLVMLVIKKVGK